MNADNGSLICALRGPVTLITLGVLFALNNFTPWGFQETWPVLLIVFGLLSLMRRAATPPRPYPAGRAPYQAAPPYQAPPPYTPPPPSGSYRQSQYGDAAASDASSGASKGGFGASGSSSQTGNTGGTQNPGGAQ